MKIKFLGSGSAFVPTKENFHSNILISHENINLLIDAGFHIGEALEFHGESLEDIDAIFLTHNHADHNGGLEYIGYNFYFNPNKKSKKPMLFGDPKVLKVLWDNVLSGNMGSLHGWKDNEKKSVGGQRVKGLDTYFVQCNVPPKNAFRFGDVSYTPVRVPHIVDDFDEVPAYGLKWECNGVKCFFSGDTQFDFWRLMPFWEYGDIIFQECEFKEYDGGCHTQFRDLVEIPDQYKEKMWLYHYSLDGKTFEELNKEVVDAGFKGLVKRGQEFNI